MLTSPLNLPGDALREAISLIIRNIAVRQYPSGPTLNHAAQRNLSREMHGLELKSIIPFPQFELDFKSMVIIVADRFVVSFLSEIDNLTYIIIF